MSNAAPGPIKELLIPPTNAMLVGGQALALWVNALDLPIPDALSAGVTVDVDYLGSKVDAHEHWKILSVAADKQSMRAEVHFPSPGDTTPNAAKITILRGTNVEAEIDYLCHLVGYVGHDEERLKNRAIVVEGLFAPGTELRVMHPFDCLRSRMHNLFSLPSKRNILHVAQANLSLSVLKAYLSRLTKEPDPRPELLPLLEELIVLAASRAGVCAYNEFGVDALSCLPDSDLPERFLTIRLPQARAYVDRRRYGRRGGRTSNPVDLRPHQMPSP